MRRGITLVELLVTFAIIAILVAVLVPAVQMVRESARKSQCQSNLRQLGIAIHSYHATHAVFPLGNLNGYSLHVSILPDIEQGSLYNSIQFERVFSHPANLRVARTRLPLFSCPSDPASDIASPAGGGYASNYAGNFGTGVEVSGYNGVFRSATDTIGGGVIRAADITDGLSQTAAISEFLVRDGNSVIRRVVWNTGTQQPQAQFITACRAMSVFTPTNHDRWHLGHPWISGQPGVGMYNHILTPNENSCTNGGFVQLGAYSVTSLHGGSVNVLFADGHVGAVSTSVDHEVWRSIGSRSGSEPHGGAF